MSIHANFAIALGMRQSVFQDLLQIYYSNNLIPHLLQQSMGGFAVDFFCDVPIISFSKNCSDCYILNLKAWGLMTVPQSGNMAGPETRNVLFTACANVPHQISIQNGELLFGVDWGNMTIDPESVHFEVFSGDPFSQDAQVWLDILKFAITPIVVPLFNSINTIIPSFKIDELIWNIVDINNSTVKASSLDGVFVIGIDTIGNINTTGDINQLEDIASDNSIGICINKLVWLGFLIESTKPAIKKVFNENGISLDRYNITIHEGYIHISGKGSQTGASVTFSMDAYPRCSPPTYGRPNVSELWLEVGNINVDIDREWWATVLEVLSGIITFGFAVFVLESLLSAMRSLAYGSIAYYGGRARAEISTEYTLPNISRPTIRVKLTSFEFHPDGVFMGIFFMPQFSTGHILSKTYINIEEVSSNMRYFLNACLPFKVHPDDPQLRVSWTVRRDDTSEIIYNVYGPTQQFLYWPLSGLIIMPIINEIKGLKIECRVYRELGATISDFLNLSGFCRFEDRLDRSHPFVYWGHYVLTPCVRKEQDGSHTYSGINVKYRLSHIHRTDWPNRCKMAVDYSLKVPWKPGWHGEKKTFIKYLDQLPFPLSEILKNREKLCDYCFFGGPNNNIPLPLPED